MMETVEKLLAQIFERKNRIIRQVKQQTDTYTQHLASKCLVDGITPPPWLWNDYQSSDVPKELNKEDLIFEILLPHPRPTIRFPSACCSLYNEPVAAGDNGELVDGFFKETSSYGKCPGSGDKQTAAAGCAENNTGCTMNIVPELAVSITSPRDDAEVRISNIYSAPDQSVARIQRSKSRQKALELRSSAKASRRSLLNQKYDPVGCPSRSRLPMFCSEQDQVTDSQDFGDPYAMVHESCRDGESNQLDIENVNKEKRTTFYAGTVRRSISSGKQSSSMKDFHNGDSFTGNLQKSGSSLRKDLHDFHISPNMVNVSPEVINSDVNAESGSFIEARTEDHLERKGKGTDNHVDRISRTSFSSQKPCLQDEAPEGGISVHPVMVGASTSAKASCKSVQQFNDANKFLELSHKRTSSGTTAGDGGISMLLDTSSSDHHRDTRSISGAIEKSQATKYAVENLSDGILPFLDTPDANQMGKFGTVIVDGPVNNQCTNPRSNIDDAALESLLTNPSDCVVFMEPKQLVFNDKEECNLKDKFRPTVEYEVQERSPNKKFYNSLHSASSVDYQLISGDMISKKQSTDQPEVTEEEEIHQGFFESNNENVDLQMKKKESDEYEEIRLNTFAVDPENMLHVLDVKYTCLAVEPNEVESPHLENHVNTYAGEVCEPEMHKEGNFSYKTKERSPCSSHHYGSKHISKSDLSCPATKAIGLSEDCSIKEVETPATTDIIIDATGQHCPGENLNLSSAGAKLYSGNLNNESGIPEVLGSSSLGGNGLLTPGSVGFPLDDHESLDLSKSEELRIAKKSVVQRNLRSLQVDSWPKSKRRKIQAHEADSFSASPSFRVKKHYPSDLNSTITNLKEAEDNVVSVPGHASVANESTEIEVYQKMACQSIDEIEPSPKVQSEKNALNSKGHGELAESSSSSALKQLGEPIASNSMEDSARASQGCLFEEMKLVGTSSDARRESDEGDNQYLLHHEGGDNLAYSDGLIMGRSLLEGKFYLGDEGQPSGGLVSSSTKKDRNLIHAGEMMPVLESLIIEPQTENADVNISGHEIDFDKFELPRTSTERASLLEQICKSTVMQTPLTQFSSAPKVHGSQKFCHSVPNGLLECMDLRSILALNEDAHNQLRVIYGNSSDSNLQKMSYSDCLSYNEARFSWDSRNNYRSPVGKLWERMSQQTGSAEKQLSSNPELTCFPIEEDPSTSEEKENTSDVTEKIQEDNGLLNDTCAKRELLADITEANVATSFSATEKFVNRATADFVSTEVSFKGVHKKVKPKLQNYGRNKSVEKENEVSSIASNGIKKAKESTGNRFSKANALSKTTLKTERQKLSEKNPKYNNIVSNVTSFIPLVQQKQAAAVCTGKRDVKVKALEAAEVAKRLEQKRQNERNMRKEALKLERARMEQENLRQMELNKKKKDEERKKRDAGIIAKKRLREEEKKEKERKKRRTEEARRLQKEEITVCSQMGGKDDIMQKSDILLEKSQNMLKECRDDVMLEKPDNNMRPEELTVNFQQAAICTEPCGTSGDSCQHQKTMPALDESAAKENLVVQNIPEKSYDISPYQCSDDEDEEEENIPNNKYIPSWASKNCVAFVLPMQQRIDPDAIFPLKSFCRIDEVYPSPKAIGVMTKKGPR